MKRLAISTTTQLLFVISTLAQTEPRIATLYPNEVEISEKILADLEAYKKTMEITEEMRMKFVNPNLPEHWQTNRKRMLDFMGEQDFFSLATSSTSNHLTYLLNSAHEVLLCFPVKDTSPADKSVYKTLCDKYGVAWIVNYTQMELKSEGGKATIEARLQLYNSISDHIWIDKAYTGTEMVSCESSPWECALSELIEKATAEIHDLLEQKRHYWDMQANEKLH